MKLSEKEIQSVIALDGNKRYEYFIKRIVDTEHLYGLYNDGWAMASDGDEKIFPVWSAKDYAEMCANDEWNGFQAKEFSLEDFLEELIPSLKQDGMRVGVFYTPHNKGVVPSFEQLESDISEEMKRYE